jgi:hypothetical protein
MAGSHSQISDEALQLKEILAALNPNDAHTICDALRAIHKRTLWLDSIVVRCPIEKAEYGGSWSIVKYNEYLEAPDVETADKILNEIKTYNAEDLLATHAVYRWLEENLC